MTTTEAEKRLSVISYMIATLIIQKTLSDEKQEILFTQFGINYNNEPPMFKKGSIIFKKEVEITAIDPRFSHFIFVFWRFRTNEQVVNKKKKLSIVHEDIISDSFWATHSYILGDK